MLLAHQQVEGGPPKKKKKKHAASSVEKTSIPSVDCPGEKPSAPLAEKLPASSNTNGEKTLAGGYSQVYLNQLKDLEGKKPASASAAPAATDTSTPSTPSESDADESDADPFAITPEGDLVGSQNQDANMGNIGQYDAGTSNEDLENLLLENNSNGLNYDDEEEYSDYGNNNDNIFGDFDNEETLPNPSVERRHKTSSLNNTASVHTTTTNNNRAPPKRQNTNRNNNARNDYHSGLDNDSIGTFDTVPTYISTRRRRRRRRVPRNQTNNVSLINWGGIKEWYDGLSSESIMLGCLLVALLVIMTMFFLFFCLMIYLHWK